MVSGPGPSISYKKACAPSEDTDQLAPLRNLKRVFPADTNNVACVVSHPRSLIWVFPVRLMTLRILGYPQSALQNVWSDCTNVRLICIFSGRTCIFCLSCATKCLGEHILCIWCTFYCYWGPLGRLAIRVKTVILWQYCMNKNTNK